MSTLTTPKKEIVWDPVLVKMLRGKRTQAEFGESIGVPKNTVWRWEAGRAAPTTEHARRLSALAEQELFLADWKLAGSITWIGDIEEGSREITRQFRKSLAR